MVVVLLLPVGQSADQRSLHSIEKRHLTAATVRLVVGRFLSRRGDRDGNEHPAKMISLSYQGNAACRERRFHFRSDRFSPLLTLLFSHVIQPYVKWSETTPIE